jgi:hypothetical protein
VRFSDPDVSRHASRVREPEALGLPAGDACVICCQCRVQDGTRSEPPQTPDTAPRARCMQAWKGVAHEQGSFLFPEWHVP